MSENTFGPAGHMIPAAFLFCAVIAGCQPNTEGKRQGKSMPLEKFVTEDVYTEKQKSTLEPGERFASAKTENPSPAEAATAEVDDGETPISDTDDFFAPPTTTIVREVQETQPTNPEYEAVRLLGFVRSAPGLQEALAILKVGNRMELMRVGDERDGLEVREINDRTVSLQRGRDSWELELLNQPVVNHSAQTREQIGSKKRPQNGNRSSIAQSTRHSPRPETLRELATQTTDIEPLQMHLPVLPELPDLPEPPELPMLEHPTHASFD